MSRSAPKKSGSRPRASPAPMMAAMSTGAEVIVTMAPAPAAVCAAMPAIVIDPRATVSMALDSSAGMSARTPEFKVVARRRGLQRDEESGKRNRRRRHFSYSHSRLPFDRALDSGARSRCGQADSPYRRKRDQFIKFNSDPSSTLLLTSACSNSCTGRMDPVVLFHMRGSRIMSANNIRSRSV
jgi:hypothetical protein